MVKARIEETPTGKLLHITVPMFPTPRLSGSGKSQVYATTGKPTRVQVEGLTAPLKIGVNAFVEN